MMKPVLRPSRPHFSSGPCAKRPGWRADGLATASLGRSHRSGLGKARLAAAIAETRAVLQVPDSHRIGIVPASDTGAVELALWSLLGARGVEVLAWEAFGATWAKDITLELKLPDVRVREAAYGHLPDLGATDWTRDVVFTWNGTTSGVRVPDGRWIATDRVGLSVCDATSAAFAQDLPWDLLDVVTFSWQKVLGGEAAHGMLILSPRAVERLESHVPSWPMPKIFRLTQKGRLSEGVFAGETLNTPSMLCVEDYLDALAWAKSIGGLPALRARAEASAAVIDGFVASRPWIAPLAVNPATRSNTSVCLTFTEAALPTVSVPERQALGRRMADLLEREGVAYDIGAYRDAPPGLRIWCGATVETGDVEALMPWLDWAYHAARGEGAA